MEVSPFIRKLIPFFAGKFSSRPANSNAGLDHLRQLLLEAHREYQNYVATNVMSPRVFACSFLPVIIILMGKMLPTKICTARHWELSAYFC